MLIKASEFDPRLTLMDSAQAFHWTQTGDRFAAIANGSLMTVCREGDDWRIESDAGESAVKTYFAQEGAALSIQDAMATESEIATLAIQALPGLRVLRQSPWEALLAFLCSANNNTARIRTLCLRLCDYGETRVVQGVTARGYPSAEALSRVSETELRERKFGYRAEYIAKTARMVADGFPIADAARLPYNEARALLMRLPGVGGKVADCVLLFGCGHDEAFPVDVWVERLLRDWFGMTATNRDTLAKLARSRFGPKAGILQQYLFHCARTGVLSLNGTRKEGETC